MRNRLLGGRNGPPLSEERERSHARVAKWLSCINAKNRQSYPHGLKHNIAMHLSRHRKIDVVYHGCVRPGDGSVRLVKDFKCLDRALK